MANTVVYKLYNGSAAAGGANQAQAQIVRKGKIIGWLLTIMAYGGAATGYYGVEITVNGVAGGSGSATLQFNNPPRDAVVAQQFVGTPTSSLVNSTIEKAGIAKNVEIGDYLNLGSILVSGTAATAATINALVYVQEE